MQSKNINKVDQLEDQNEYLKQKIYNISNQIDDDVYVLPKILGNEEIISNNGEIFYLTKYFSFKSLAI